MANLSHKHGRPFKGLRRASPSYRKRFDHGEPISKIDTRPMVFVATFLAIVMFLSASEMQPHAFYIDLWHEGEDTPLSLANNEVTRIHNETEIVNQVSVTNDGALLWNCEPITSWELHSLLNATLSLPIEPITSFFGEPDAPYEVAAKTLHQIKASGITKFEFSGLEDHRNFASQSWSASGNSLNVALTLLPPEDLPDTSIDWRPYASKGVPIIECDQTN